MREQGTYLDCPYCTILHPEFKTNEKCPYCHGKGPYFTPARMMDKDTSERELWTDIMDLGEKWHGYRDETLTPNHMFDELLSLLSRIELYHFSIKDALITILLDLEQEIPRS